MPLPLASNDGPLRSHYSYTSTGHGAHADNSSMSMPRYVDSNPRPSKSPRQSGHQSVHSGGSVGDSTGTASSSDYRYGSTGASSYRGSENAYPPSSSWATTSSEHSSSSAYAAADARSYSFSSHEPYRAGGTIPPLKHEPNSSVYSGGPRGSFDSINNYSWSAA
ncbi:hypothetical protein CDD82_6668 [Ophiocordyceps australis]|uniref:Uncharacterized protein n=1 Tax=Ophiocordyceps australis TaxID=1399860 RepID=A0A2C5YUN7_9HYPO|nr:hypothetical protein CDD82_6668 [Ophiocordyceps australis]